MHGYKASQVLEVMLFLVVSSILSAGGLVALLCAFKPRSVICLGGLIPQKHYSYFPWGLLFVLFQNHLIAVVSLNIAISASVLLLFLYFIYIFLAQELLLSRTSLRTVELFRNYEYVRHAYRSLQILYAQLEYPLGGFLIFLHLIFSILPIYGFFELICYGNNFDAVTFCAICALSFCYIGFWTVLLELGKYFCVNGEKTFRSWKLLTGLSAKESRLISKFKTSCKPTLISYGKTFGIQKITPFTYIKGNIRGVMRSVLTLPKA